MSEHLSKEEIFKRLEQDIQANEEMRERLNEKYSGLIIKSIEQIRIWVYQVITISSAILGAFILLGGNSSFVRNRGHLLIAFILLIIVIIYGISHLKRVIENDINGLTKQADLMDKTVKRVIDAKKQIVIEPTKESYDKLLNIQQEGIFNPPETKAKLIYSYDIILLLFVLGLAFMLLSMIDFNEASKFLMSL